MNQTVKALVAGALMVAQCAGCDRAHDRQDDAPETELRRLRQVFYSRCPLPDFVKEGTRECGAAFVLEDSPPPAPHLVVSFFGARDSAQEDMLVRCIKDLAIEQRIKHPVVVTFHRKGIRAPGLVQISGSEPYRTVSISGGASNTQTPQ